MAEANPHTHLRIEIDYAGRTDGQPVYVGYANPNSATDQPLWQIQFLEYDGGNNFIRRTWADGDIYFDNIWDDRAGLSYS